MKMETKPVALGFLAGALTWIVLVTLATCGACAHVPFTPLTLRGHVEQERAAVLVESACYDGDPFEGSLQIKGGRGSGVIVTERHVLTALHVVSCPGGIADVHVTTFEGKRYRAVVEREDSEHDLARLQLFAAGNFELGIKRPLVVSAFVGDAACAATAFPTRAWNCGTVEMVGYTIHHTALSLAGNSGAGMYVDGQLVGIVVTRQFCDAEDMLDGEASCGGAAARLTPDWIPG